MTADDETPPAVAPEDRITDDPPRHSPLWRLLSGWVLALEAWLRSHGGEPLRFGIRAFWGLIAAVGLFLLIGPVINPPLTLDDILDSSETATDQWIARDFTVDYTVELADDGTLVTHVEERITAFFPDDVDQSGIQRVLATDFHAHELRPSDISATLDGTSIAVEEETEPTLLTLTIDSGERLQGNHDIVLRYTLHHLAFVTEDRATGSTVDMLQWDVFGPAWSTAIAGLEVRVILADELDDALIRDPRGTVAWTILSAGEWLEPEETSPAGYTTYAFSNDQNLPPYANAIFTFVFEPGTIAMPEPSTWFWVQTFGPLVPLVFLLLTLLLAIAARLVAWSDARGRPWYVAQFEAPEGVSARLAAHILRSPRTLELADALDAIPRRGAAASRREKTLAAGRVAKRTGRLGDAARALALYVRGPERAHQLTRNLRRIPKGFVRDAFIAAPIALTLVQWGLVRQLSHQTLLSEVWWPVAFVLLSTLISVIVLALALSARPLTVEGALVKQHLMGIGVYAERTSLLERGPLQDAALPYAVLTTPPRAAGTTVAALVEADLGEPIPARSWLTSDYLTAPRLLMRVLALLVVVGSILVVALVANPYQRTHRYLMYDDDVPGSSWTQVEGFAATAELSRDDDGRAVIEASETLTVLFEEGSSLPPQLVRQWRNVVDGQSLDVTIERVLLDGSPVPYATETDFDSLVMRTAFTSPVTGQYEVRIDYRIGSAAVADDAGGAVVDRVWWVALLQGWKYDYGNEDQLLEPLLLEFSVSEELAELSTQAGWITLDTSPDVRASEWPAAVIPFGEIRDEVDDDSAIETATRDDGVLVHTLEIGHTDIDAYPWSVTIRDLGTMMDFPAGTFVGPDESALRATQFAAAWPLWLTVALGWLGFGMGLLGIVLIVRGRQAVIRAGVLRDVLLWLAPALGIAAVILFVWAASDVEASHPVVGPTGWAALAGIGGAAASLFAAWWARRGVN